MTERRLEIALFLCALAGAIRCASAPARIERDDRFPLDPREELVGPFDESVDRGWRALAAGDPARARLEFSRAEGEASARAAAIGGIEASIVEGRSNDAVAKCGELLETAEATLPLLVACGEARARTSDPLAAFELYDRAAQRAPDRPGVRARAERLRDAAAASLLASAERSAAGGLRDEAHAEAARGVSLAPGSSELLARAAGVECEIGEKQRALDYYREALAIGGLEAVARERIGDLGLETGENALAVSVFERLAVEDPRYHDRADEARLAFRIANWPDPERQAAHSRRLSRAGAASLTWWMCPEVREAKVRAGIVATDVLERRDSRAVMRAISLGLLDVDSYAHRARPDAPLTRSGAAQWLVRLAAFLEPAQGETPSCLKGAAAERKAAEALAAAVRCDLLAADGGPVVSGAEFTRGLDRLRALPGMDARP